MEMGVPGGGGRLYLKIGQIVLKNRAIVLKNLANQLKNRANDEREARRVLKSSKMEEIYNVVKMS